MKYKLLLYIVLSIILFCCSKEEIKDVEKLITSISDIGEFEYENRIVTKIGNDSLIYNNDEELVQIVRFRENQTLDPNVFEITKNVVEYSLHLERSTNKTILYLDTITSLSTIITNTDSIVSSNKILEIYYHNSEYLLDSVVQLNFFKEIQKTVFNKSIFTYNERNNLLVRKDYGYLPFEPDVFLNDQRFVRTVKFSNYDGNNNLICLIPIVNAQFIPSLSECLYSENNPLKSNIILEVNDIIVAEQEIKFEYLLNESKYPTTISRNQETNDLFPKLITYAP